MKAPRSAGTTNAFHTMAFSRVRSWVGGAPSAAAREVIEKDDDEAMISNLRGLEVAAAQTHTAAALYL
jgi:hypothetical protein